jgi:hypothetical protein
MGTQEAVMTHTIKDREVAVSTEVYYLPMSSCPVGVKCLLLNPGGSAVLAQYNGKETCWQGWYPLPRKPPTVLK